VLETSHAAIANIQHYFMTASSLSITGTSTTGL